MNLTVLFAVLSAAFWFGSALIKTPRNVWFQAHVGAGAPNREFEEILSRLRWQSHLNAVAAAFAALSAFTRAWGA